MGRDRIADATVVCFAFEGELKEAALVTAGQATFSVPAVGMWDTPELAGFVRNHLVGKLVLIIPDSDAVENEQVIRHAILAKGRLDWLGARAEIAIPWAEGVMSQVDLDEQLSADPEEEAERRVRYGEQPWRCSLHEAAWGAKRGVDDYLADGGRIEDLRWLRREPGKDLATWLDENGKTSPSGRRPRSPRVEADNVILRRISLLADKDGRYSGAEHALAKQVRSELEELKGKPFGSQQSVTADVSKAIHRMDKVFGALSGSDSLPERRWGRDYDEWPGELRVHPDLRAKDEYCSLGDLLDSR